MNLNDLVVNGVKYTVVGSDLYAAIHNAMNTNYIRGD